MSDSLERLYMAILAAQHLDPATSRTARLLAQGSNKVAKKVAEEAIEVVIDAVSGDRTAVVKESADLLYNLSVLWVASGVQPQDVWDEMDRRERMMGLAEKLPKPSQFKPQLKASQAKPQKNIPPSKPHFLNDDAERPIVTLDSASSRK